MRLQIITFLLILQGLLCPLFGQVELGIERLLFEKQYSDQLKGKRIGLLTNHTGVTQKLVSTIDLVRQESKHYTLKAFFAPEHGLMGNSHAGDLVDHSTLYGLPVYSLHGSTRRPTVDMLKDIDIVIFDIQDIGSRSYTYISTLFYLMEECAKHKILVIVADRPNPLGGNLIDGLSLDESWRSFLGYVDVPYCHGMTVGELATYFNAEYKVGCDLVVVPMKGWKRDMVFEETGLPWIPLSPQIPESDTPFYYPTTGLIGELQMVNIGVGYTMPFKLVGAPWISADSFCSALNSKKFPGVHFRPIYYRPFFGSFAGKECQGAHIIITDKKIFNPVETQFLIMGTLKGLYPEKFGKALEEVKKNKDIFCKASGGEKIYKMLHDEKYIIFPLKKLCQESRERFVVKRQKYLIRQYS